jgi:hypothetical protein
MGKNMVKDKFNGMMKINILVNGNMIKFLDMVLKILKMVIYMTDISLKINFLVKVNYSYLLEIAIQVNLKIIFFMVMESILMEII